MSSDMLREFRLGVRDGFREAATSPRLQRRVAVIGILLGGAVAIALLVRQAAG